MLLLITAAQPYTCKAGAKSAAPVGLRQLLPESSARRESSAALPIRLCRLLTRNTPTARPTRVNLPTSPAEIPIAKQVGTFALASAHPQRIKQSSDLMGGLPPLAHLFAFPLTPILMTP